MARKLRIQCGGAIYRVTFRGNARHAIFVDDRDRERLTERVGESAEDFGARGCGYCRMPNRGHLLVETPAVNVSALMASVLNGQLSGPPSQGAPPCRAGHGGTFPPRHIGGSAAVTAKLMAAVSGKSLFAIFRADPNCAP